LGQLPQTFINDEAAFGYNAYSLIHTGKDEFGKSWPFIFSSFGDNKLPVYTYLAIPSILIFGLNPFAVRIPGVVFSVISILLIYLISKKLFHNPFISLMSAFILAVSPWHIVFSRISFEAMVAFTCFLIGTYFYLNVLSSFRISRYFIASAFFYILAFATYRSYWITIPLFLISTYFLLIFPKFFKRAVFYFVLIGIGLMVILHISDPSASKSRSVEVSIFNDKGVTIHSFQQLQEEGLQRNKVLSRLFHNPFIDYLSEFFYHYSHHFTGDFLFIGRNWYSPQPIPDVGVLYFIDIFFLLAGFIYLVQKNPRSRLMLIPIILLLTGPVSSSFTKDTPNTMRSIQMLASFPLILGSGFYFIWRMKFVSKYRYISSLVLTIIYGLSFMYALRQYTINREERFPYYNLAKGYQALVNEITSLNHQYSKFVITSQYGQPYIFLLFYMSYPPSNFQHEFTLTSPNDEGIYDVSSFNKYIFEKSDCPVGKIEPNTVYVCKGDRIPADAQLLKTIKFNSNDVAFQVITFDDKYVKSLPKSN